MLFKNFIYLASIAATAYGATVADVLADLAAVKARVTTLDSSIAAFSNPGGTLAQALTIHSNAGTTKTAIDKTNTDALTVAGPVSDSDGTSIINAITDIQPLINSALTGIVDKKPAIDALPIGGVPALVKQDLADLQASTNALEDTLIARTPASLLAQAQALQSQINAAFATAVAAYA